MSAQVPAEPGAPGERPSAAPPDRPFSWRRLTRSRRGAAGLGIAAAALLLSPFADWLWLPWLAGLGALLLLRLLRLDGLLHGWTPHLAGLVVVAGLMMSTGPWAWALAASIGVLLAGLVQLPWWRLAAVGAVLCVISGVGFGFSVYQAAELRRQIEAHAGDPMRIQLGETRPARVLPAMLQAVRLDDADPICRLLTPAAEQQLLQAIQAPDCVSAVTKMHRRAPSQSPIDADSLPQPALTADGWSVSSCGTAWAVAASPELGRIHIGRISPSVDRFDITGFAPC